MKTVSEYAKSALFILILLQIAPPLLHNIKENYLAFLTPHTKIGRITIDAIITDSTFYAKNLKKFFKNPEIKAILLKINCPGGVTGSSQALFNEIQELKKKYPKPIVTLSENICTSGGYYVACATDSIIAAPSCLVAGVGTTLTTLFNFKELAQHWHIKTSVISSGAYKGATNQFHDITPEQQAMLQAVADDSYQQFAADVAKTRKLSLKEREKWAEGKVFTGQRALELHMIDQTGSYSQALEKIKSMAPIEGKVQWVDPEERLSFFERIMGGSQGPSVTTITQQVCQAIEQRYQTLLAT